MLRWGEAEAEIDIIYITRGRNSTRTSIACFVLAVCFLLIGRVFFLPSLTSSSPFSVTAIADHLNADFALIHKERKVRPIRRKGTKCRDKGGQLLFFIVFVLGDFLSVLSSLARLYFSGLFVSAQFHSLALFSHTLCLCLS